MGKFLKILFGILFVAAVSAGFLYLYLTGVIPNLVWKLFRTPVPTVQEIVQVTHDWTPVSMPVTWTPVDTSTQLPTRVRSETPIPSETAVVKLPPRPRTTPRPSGGGTTFTGCNYDYYKYIHESNLEFLESIYNGWVSFYQYYIDQATRDRDAYTLYWAQSSLDQETAKYNQEVADENAKWESYLASCGTR